MDFFAPPTTLSGPAHLLVKKKQNSRRHGTQSSPALIGIYDHISEALCYSKTHVLPNKYLPQITWNQNSAPQISFCDLCQWTKNVDQMSVRELRQPHTPSELNSPRHHSETLAIMLTHDSCVYSKHGRKPAAGSGFFPHGPRPHPSVHSSTSHRSTPVPVPVPAAPKMAKLWRVGPEPSLNPSYTPDEPGIGLGMDQTGRLQSLYRLVSGSPPQVRSSPSANSFWSSRAPHGAPDILAQASNLLCKRAYSIGRRAVTEVTGATSRT